MKIAHITDMSRPPRLSEMTGKRLRAPTSPPRGKFSLAQEAAVAAVVAAELDVWSSPATSQPKHWTPSSLPHESSDPIPSRFPTVMIPVITTPMSASRHPVTACASLRTVDGFGYADLIVHGDVAFLTLETC